MKINILFGPAKVGKTTFLQNKKLEGCCILSGGDYAYQLAENTARYDIALAKEDKDNMELALSNRTAARQTIINYIENQLIGRVFGSRKEFVRAFVSAQLDMSAKEVWHEALNNLEAEYVLSAISGQVDVKFWEMHRHGISYGADRREASHAAKTHKIFAQYGEFVYDGVEIC